MCISPSFSDFILQLTHATSQNLENAEDFLYKCFWTGCKVFGKGSSSKSWLEKHVTNHGGNKPFQCIVDGCKMRFGTQSLLERHVNNHFKSPANSSSAPSSSNGSGSEYTARKSGEPMGSLPTPPPSAIKLIRKAGKKLKYRKTIFSARIFDLFDLGVMAQVQERLTQMSARGKNELNITGENVTFTSEVLARRKDIQTGETMLLLKWKPHDM